MRGRGQRPALRGHSGGLSPPHPVALLFKWGRVRSGDPWPQEARGSQSGERVRSQLKGNVFFPTRSQFPGVTPSQALDLSRLFPGSESSPHPVSLGFTSPTQYLSLSESLGLFPLGGGPLWKFLRLFLFL